MSYIKGYIRNLFKRNISLLALVDSASKVDDMAKINRCVKFVNSSVGRYSYVGPGSIVVSADIGAFCSIACDVYIGLAGHTLDFLSTSPIFTERHNGTGHSWISEDIAAHKNQRVAIGNDVWIGHGCKILSGIKIGDGAVIAAGAVVTKDVNPFEIVGGVPAHVIRKRFNDDVIESILSSKWWELSDETIKHNITNFQKPILHNSVIDSILPPPEFLG